MARILFSNRVMEWDMCKGESVAYLNVSLRGLNLKQIIVILFNCSITYVCVKLSDSKSVEANDLEFAKMV